MAEYRVEEAGLGFTIDTKYYNQLDIEGFSHMMKDPSYCYKFYWLEAIVQLISEGVTETTFDTVIDEMICNAWYSVREFHIHLSGMQLDGQVRDGLERAIIRLSELSSLPANASKVEIKNAIKEHNTELKAAKEQLTNMVPYRALAGFFDKAEEVADWGSVKRMTAYIERINRVKRDALTREQERKFLEFIQQDKHYRRYYDAFYILFKTGLRISEFCGLTIKDIDFRKKVIKVNHQLQRTSEMKYICESTKTGNGVRDVPMTPDVVDAFKRIIKNRPKPKIEPIVDGYSGFLFLDKNGKPRVALHWEKYFQLSVRKYNSIYRVQLPQITPHVCRHTFCTNMAKSGMNPKVLQYIMGHGDISVTLDTYTHIKSEDAIAEMERLDLLMEKEA